MTGDSESLISSDDHSGASAGQNASAQPLEVVWHRFGDQLRRRARTRLRQYGLTGQAESMDICNDVMADLARRHGDQGVSPDDVLAYILRAIDNQVLDTFRTLARQCRDFRRNELTPVEDMTVANREVTPSQIALRREVVARIRSMLSEEDAKAIDMMLENRDWNEIGTSLGLKADTARMRVRRAEPRADRYRFWRRGYLMGEVVDPQIASIDGLIDWLREKRRRDPASRLSELISGHKFDERRLVDIACIDLMQRQRMNHAVSVEGYVDDFPCLRTDANLLDLIDAELCVAIELGSHVDVDDYVRRFPGLADKVRELIQLELGAEAGMTSGLIRVGNAMGSFDDELSTGQTPASRSKDFSIEVLPQDAPTKRIASLTPHPVDVPEWFVGDQCVASGPGRWLIRGRDSVRGIALALKVTELPAQLSDVQSRQILDACEAASKVRNPTWVLPSVAAIQQRHLGVIRPWLFARPWQTYRASHDHGEHLRHLAAVAFAVESAHRVGATHGGIHVENLLIDHDGKVQVMDAGSSRIGLERWLSPARRHADAEQIASLDERINVDTQDVIKLVAAASVDWEHEWARDLVVELRRIAASHPGDACGMLGQTLIKYADAGGRSGSSGGSTPSWRKRLAGWLAK